MTPFAVSTVAFIGAVIFGYVISLFTGSRNLGDHDVTALTIYGRRATYTRRTSSSPSLAATASAGDSNNTEQGQINE